MGSQRLGHDWACTCKVQEKCSQSEDRWLAMSCDCADSVDCSYRTVLWGRQVEGVCCKQSRHCSPELQCLNEAEPVSGGGLFIYICRRHGNRSSEGKGVGRIQWRNPGSWGQISLRIWHLIKILKNYDLNLELSENDVLGANLKLP